MVLFVIPFLGALRPHKTCRHVTTSTLPSIIQPREVHGFCPRWAAKNQPPSPLLPERAWLPVLTPSRMPTPPLAEEAILASRDGVISVQQQIQVFHAPNVPQKYVAPDSWENREKRGSESIEHSCTNTVCIMKRPSSAKNKKICISIATILVGS